MFNKSIKHYYKNTKFRQNEYFLDNFHIFIFLIKMNTSDINNLIKSGYNEAEIAIEFDNQLNFKEASKQYINLYTHSYFNAIICINNALINIDDIVQRKQYEKSLDFYQQRLIEITSMQQLKNDNTKIQYGPCQSSKSINAKIYPDNYDDEYINKKTIKLNENIIEDNNIKKQNELTTDQKIVLKIKEISKIIFIYTKKGVKISLHV